MTLESNVQECHVTTISYNILKNEKSRRQESTRIFAVCFRGKSGQKNVPLIEKNIDFSLLVKSSGEQLYFEDILTAKIIFSETISKSRNRLV